MKSIFTFLFVLCFSFLVGQNDMIVSATINAVCESGPLAGSITLSVEGGTPPYTFNWGDNSTSSKITHLGSGAYYVTITDSTNRFVIDSFWIEPFENLNEDVEWSKNFGGSGNDEVIDILQLEDGGYLLIGRFENKSTLMKISQCGDIEWNHNYEISDLVSLARDRYGSIYIGGHALLQSGDARIIKTDQFGALIWSKNFGDEFKNTLVEMDVKSTGEVAMLLETHHDYYISNPNYAKTPSIHVNVVDTIGNTFTYYKRTIFNSRFQGWGEAYGLGLFTSSKDHVISMYYAYTRDGLNLRIHEQPYFIDGEPVGGGMGSSEWEGNFESNCWMDGLTNLNENIVIIGKSFFEAINNALFRTNGTLIHTISSNGSRLKRKVIWDKEFYHIAQNRDSLYYLLDNGTILLTLDQNLDTLSVQQINNDNTTVVNELISTKDGGLVFAGSSSRPSNLVLNHYGGKDFWIVKMVKQPTLRLYPVQIENDCGNNTGKIEIPNIYGGIEPFSFSWSNGDSTNVIIELAAGVYYLTISDSVGKTISKSFEVKYEPLAFMNANLHNDCGNSSGFIQLEVSENWKGPINAVWNIDSLYGLNVDGLEAGEYSVSITDSLGCIIIDTFQIENLEYEFEYVETKLCKENEGEIFISPPTTAVRPFQYNWSNGAFGSRLINLSTGTYIVEFKDALGCTIIDTINLDGEPMELDSILLTPSCFAGDDGKIDILFSGGVPPFTFLVDNRERDLDKLSPGIYEIEVIDSNFCDLRFYATISNNNFASNSSSTPADGNNSNGTATFDPRGDYPPYSYLWETDPIQTTQTAINLASGNYNCKITDSLGCWVIYNVVVEQTSSMDEKESNQFQIYPNPSSGQVHFEINQVEDWHLTITDISGKLMETEKGRGAKKLTINNLSAGVYLAKLNFAEEFITKKLVIQP